MPVSFLTAEQERRYGRYAGEPSAEQLARHFHLDDADRELAGTKRWDHMRLGFAVQLGTVRFLGAFLDEPAAVPGGVAGHLAQQLGIPNAGCLTKYATARGRWLHSAEIKERHGYREFADPAVHFRLARWLYALCWTGTDRPSVLFDRATVWLVTEKVLLPGASALERLVARIRARAARRLWRTLARDVTPEQRTKLDALLVAGEGGRPSPLDRLRDGPYLRSGAELSRAVGRLDEVRELTLAGSLKLGTVQAAGLIRTLQTKDRPTKLARALEELGRLIKTLYLLRFINDEAYRRRILVQLNRGEGRHQLARVVFHGKRGELRQRYREGQEDQLGSLGLVVNVIVLWNTIYMDVALGQLRAEGFDMRAEDVARLSPLGFDHINMLGRYAFILPDQIARGELRPLRDPTSMDDES